MERQIIEKELQRQRMMAISGRTPKTRSDASPQPIPSPEIIRLKREVTDKMSLKKAHEPSDPDEVVHQVLGERVPTAVVSGPTFAKEVGAGLVTAMTVAASDATFANDLAQRLSGMNFRAYTSADMVGVETGGAIKNVLAIGAGISDGLGFGANTRIALITRGLVELTRLGVALGARKDTFMGLAGLGDLVLTCTDNQSRNRRFGLALASGTTAAAAQKSIGQVVEGVQASRAVRDVAARLSVEMPICEQVYRVIHEDASPKDAVKELMSRALKPE